MLSEDDLRRLLADCEGKEFEDRRDAAIIRLLADTGMRRGERLAAGPPRCSAVVLTGLQERIARILAELPEVDLCRAGPPTIGGGGSFCAADETQPVLAPSTRVDPPAVSWWPWPATLQTCPLIRSSW